MSDDLVQRVTAELPRAVADLTRLVSIPSVSSQPEHADDVRLSADVIAELLTDAGCPDVRIVSAQGGAPAVVGRYPAPAGTPTVCLYAHHDVQPVGDLAKWHTPALDATQVGDRLYGRGTADDKAGVIVHLAALRAFDGHPPVGVTVFVEGEEEVGSPTLAAIVAEHGDLLAADAYVIADSGNWEVGYPAFTTTLRGVTDCVVEVATLDHAVHSGAFGGMVPDAVTALCRLLATLHHPDGSVAIEGLVTGTAPALEYPADRFREESGILDGVDYLGTGTIVDRLWAGPSATVIAMDVPSIADASNTLVPTASAKISVRVAPGDTAANAQDRLVAHLESHAPWGAKVTVTRGSLGDPGVLPFTGPIADAARDAFTQGFGIDPVLIGQGGSIPLAGLFQQAFPHALVLVSAVSDPDSRMHSPNESVHLGDVGKAAVSEALLLEALARS